MTPLQILDLCFVQYKGHGAFSEFCVYELVSNGYLIVPDDPISLTVISDAYLDYWDSPIKGSGMTFGQYVISELRTNGYEIVTA